MRKLLFLALICTSTLALAQESRRNVSSPFALPISVDATGKLSLFGDNKTTEFSLNPTVLGGIVRNARLYSFPKIANKFTFSPIDQSHGFVSVRKFRIEAGLGLSTILKSVSTIGLVPFKGALQTMTQFKENKNTKNHSMRIPRKFESMLSWNVGDRGTYETYGGVIAYFSASAGIVDIAKASIRMQNQFEIEISKVEDNKIKAIFTEGSIKHRQLKVGPFMSTFTKTAYVNKALRAEFTFDLDNPAHEILFTEALSGNFQQAADELESSFQEVSWQGKERELFLGIPILAGRTISKADFEMKEGDSSYDIDYKHTKNNGVLTAERVHQKLVYQTDESIALIWSSQMQQTHGKAFHKNFFVIGKTLGIKGFDKNLDKNFFHGSLYTQMALEFSREDYLEIQKINLESIKDDFQSKCIQEKLACGRENRTNKVLKKFKNLISGNWDDNKDDVGLFLMDEPALISSLVGYLGLRKELYFKFLSEKFQSLEGKALIAF